MRHHAIDEKWMALALAEAVKGIGLTRPNPPVGAVVVHRGKLVGTGWHRKAGTPHAEVHALHAAGRKARGATVYVTLEPCSTFGRTPPCTDALIAAGVARVVVGCLDPNPIHSGKGIRLLKKAGIKVSVGVLKKECIRIIRPFAARMLLGRPFVTLKLATTLDGRIADHRGDSKWITGSASRRQVHALRRAADAILVGAGTVRADNPSLVPVPSRGRKPWRVVISKSGCLPAGSRLFTDEAAERTLVYVPANAGAVREMEKSVTRHGASVVLVPGLGGQFLRHVFLDLADRGVMQVLCEGGGQLAGALMEAGLVDELQIFQAGKVLGKGASAVEAKGWSLARAPGFLIRSLQKMGGDVHIVAEPEV